MILIIWCIILYVGYKVIRDIMKLEFYNNPKSNKPYGPHEPGWWV